jgi:hypothetical protein
MIDEDNEGHDGQGTMIYEEVHEMFCNFRLERGPWILELDS